MRGARGQLAAAAAAPRAARAAPRLRRRQVDARRREEAVEELMEEDGVRLRAAASAGEARGGRGRGVGARTRGVQARARGVRARAKGSREATEKRGLGGRGETGAGGGRARAWASTRSASFMASSSRRGGMSGDSSSWRAVGRSRGSLAISWRMMLA